MTALPIPIEYVESPRPVSDRGISAEANDLRRLFESGRESDTSFGFTKRWWELDKACWSSSVDNWDGSGAPAVDGATYERAKAFLEAFPRSASEPIVGVDPDGEVSFTWSRAPTAVFTVSIGGSGQLSYAGLFGQSTVYGMEHFVDEIPKAVWTNLARLFSTSA